MIVEQSLEKINARLSHKDISRVLQRRLENDLKDYMNQTLDNIKRNEMFMLKLQLFNTQLGLGNSEMRKLTKNTD